MTFWIVWWLRLQLILPAMAGIIALLHLMALVPLSALAAIRCAKGPRSAREFTLMLLLPPLL
jgi:hypothetical protein